MTKKPRLLSAVIAFLISVVLLFASGTWVFAAIGETLSAAAIQNFQAQLKIIKAEKKSFTAVQRKVNASIIRHLHVKVLRDRPDTLPKFQNRIGLNDKNEILTDIKATVSDSVLKTITDNGGTIINQFPQYRAIRALIPITAVETIAGHPDIQFINKAALCETRKATTSEGDVAHNAGLVRAKGYTGAGIKVGVLSDSVDYLANVQATGDLPAVTVLQNAPGNSGEGTAMLEIVYDLAPASPLYFATAWNGAASFANNIIALKNAGCKVIVDDVGYFNESPFQDDVISQAVSTVTAAGVFYFSSAGNSGNKRAGTSGTWEGDYVDNNPGGTFDDWHLHAFAPGVWYNQLLSNPGIITLFWSDALGHSGNDYDLYVYDGTDIIDGSFDTQNGTQDPYEAIIVGYATPVKPYAGYWILIDRFSPDAGHISAPRFLHLNASRAQTQYSTNGETRGHATVESAFCVSAVNAGNRTTPFTGAEALETFTSDGPRRVFYYPDGTAITPGNLSSTGGYVRKKPDITAADGVKCSTPGFPDFHGTSAAAPHAAAITALLLSAKPGATAAQIRNALTKSALPAPPVWNDVAGSGIIMADRALKLLPRGIESAYLLMLMD